MGLNRYSKKTERSGRGQCIRIVQHFLKNH